MTPKRFLSATILMLTASLMVQSNHEPTAMAWEANGMWSMRTRSPQMPPPPFPFWGVYRLPLPYRTSQDPDPFRTYDVVEPRPFPTEDPPKRLYVKKLHTTHSLAKPLAGLTPMQDGSSGPTTNLFVCDHEGVEKGSEAAHCKPLQNQDVRGAEFAWVAVRKSWATDVSPRLGGDFMAPEHMEITQWAAHAAGLDPTGLFTQTYWVRYPSKNKYIASPFVDNDAYVASVAHPPDQWILGPSYLPETFTSGDSMVQRAVFLPELAQLPDIVWSVSDWSAGAETCPISQQLHTTAEGVDFPLFTSSAEVNVCHSYPRVMGPLNASHFLPAAKNYYQYYHQLALDRMYVCKTMADKLKPIYDAYNTVFQEEYEDYASRADTEYHECEREAFIFEMFAVHFLEDSWSSGHMWRRWGTTNFGDFPDRVDFYSPSDQFAANAKARQMSIGAVIAMLVGSIHGSKSVLVDKLGTYLPTDSSARRTIINDPLNFPFFYGPNCEPRTVQFLSGLTGFPALGDNYFSPPTGDNPSLVDNDIFASQRNGLLSCVASSLREIYMAGPQSHGPMGPSQMVNGVSPDLSTDPRSDKCWAHNLTNESMKIGVGPITSLYTPNPDNDSNHSCDPAPILPLVNYVTTKFLPDMLTATLQFPIESEKKPFIKSVESSASRDVQNLLVGIEENIKRWGPLDTASSSLIIRGAGSEQSTEMTMLNTKPQSFNGVSLPNASSDWAVPRPGHDEDVYVPRMFWRSHLAETCQIPDTTIMNLRDRCIAAASNGGDPNACTSCTELTEPRIPVYTTHNGNYLFLPSKCESIEMPSSQDILPQKFWDSAFRETAEGFTTSYQLALRYCTGTSWANNLTFQSNLNSYSVTEYEETSTLCTITKDPYTAMIREGIALAEHTRSSSQPSSAPHGVHPVVTSLQGQEDVYYDKNCVVQIQDPDIELLATYATLPGGMYWRDDNSNKVVVSPANESAVALCGVTQRVSWWNTSCGEAKTMMGVKSGALNDGEMDPQTGLSFHDSVFDDGELHEDRCELMEPIQFNFDCPNQLQCGVNGLCSCSSGPEIITLSGGLFDLANLLPKKGICGVAAGAGGAAGASGQGGNNHAGTSNQGGTTEAGGNGGNGGVSGSTTEN